MLHVSFSNMFDFIVAKTKIQWYLGDTSENGRRQYPIRNQLDTRGGGKRKIETSHEYTSSKISCLVAHPHMDITALRDEKCCVNNKKNKDFESLLATNTFSTLYFDILFIVAILDLLRVLS